MSCSEFRARSFIYEPIWATGQDCDHAQDPIRRESQASLGQVNKFCMTIFGHVSQRIKKARLGDFATAATASATESNNSINRLTSHIFYSFMTVNTERISICLFNPPRVAGSSPDSRSWTSHRPPFSCLAETFLGGLREWSW